MKSCLGPPVFDIWALIFVLLFWSLSKNVNGWASGYAYSGMKCSVQYLYQQMLCLANVIICFLSHISGSSNLCYVWFDTSACCWLGLLAQGYYFKDRFLCVSWSLTCF